MKKKLLRKYTYKPVNIIYKWKLDYITFPTKKEWSDFIEMFKRYDKIPCPIFLCDAKNEVVCTVITIAHTHKRP